VVLCDTRRNLAGAEEKIVRMNDTKDSSNGRRGTFGVYLSVKAGLRWPIILTQMPFMNSVLYFVRHLRVVSDGESDLTISLSVAGVYSVR
jgi:hypothetical protein